MNEQRLEATLAAMREDMSREAGQAFVGLMSEYLGAASQGQGAVSTSLRPQDLAPRFAEPPPQTGRPLMEVVERLSRDVMADSLRLAHPMYMGPPVPPVLPATAWTEALVGGLNQSVRTFDMSPTGTVLERQVVCWLAQWVGYGPRAGGTFTSGGTESNFTALLAARAACMPESWHEGVGANPPVILCGENAHLSVFRAAAELGLGHKRALTIPLRGQRMDPDALEARLRELKKEGREVMAVVATVGAFGTGAFDELDAISRSCEAHGVWLHVDACHGGTALLSEHHRHRLRGIERARSVSWNPHKMMMVPLSAAALLFREERDLDRAFLAQQAYPAPDAPRGWSQLHRSFSSSRRLDALKVWVALQRHGAAGLGAIYDHLCRLTLVMHDAIKVRGDFEALHTPDINVLCFRYVGDGSLGDEALEALNRQVYRRYMQSGQGWLCIAPPIQGRFGLRVTLMNPFAREEHIHALLEGLATVARESLSGLARPATGEAS